MLVLLCRETNIYPIKNERFVLYNIVGYKSASSLSFFNRSLTTSSSAAIIIPLALNCYVYRPIIIQHLPSECYCVIGPRYLSSRLVA